MTFNDKIFEQYFNKITAYTITFENYTPTH